MEAATGLAIATSILVGITAWYAYGTHRLAGAAKRQADANARMAREMEQARHDALRPVIEILAAALTANQLSDQHYAGGIPPSRRCRLRNVGVGPALNVRFDVWNESRNVKVSKGITAVPPGEYAREWPFKKPIEEWPLAVERPVKAGEGVPLLRVCYEDVFGNALESVREMVTGEELGPFGDVGPLSAEGT